LKTGKTEIIVGLKAEQFIQKYEDGRIDEAWETNQLDVSPKLKLGLIPFFGRFAFSESSSIAEKDRWDLRTVRRWPDGSIWSMTEATRIEHVSLCEDIFKIPTDYKTIEEHPHHHPKDTESDKKYSY